MNAAHPRVRVHVVGVDDDQRMLLARRPRTREWMLPWAYLRTGEDPSRLARNLVQDTGGRPDLPQVVGVESAVELGEHFLDITFRCSAKRVWGEAPAGDSSLWWSLGELSSLDLTTRTRTALVTAWPTFWPNT